MAAACRQIAPDCLEYLRQQVKTNRSVDLQLLYVLLFNTSAFYVCELKELYILFSAWMETNTGMLSSLILQTENKRQSIVPILLCQLN